MNTEMGRTNYERFDPASASGGDDASKRAYLRVNIVSKLSAIAKSEPLLEIGPGRGALLALLKEEGFTNVSAFEVCEAFAQDLNGKGYATACGPSAVSYLRQCAPATWAAIVLVDVLEHFERDEAIDFLVEAQRVLKPGGTLVIQVPNLSGLFGANTFYADFTHKLGFNEIGLTSLLRAAGFGLITVGELKLPPSPANRLRSVARSLVFACLKFVVRVVGATPIQVYTHNMVAVVTKS